MTASTVCSESTSAFKALSELLSGILGPDFGIACTGVDGDPQALYPAELATMRKAIPRRQREFAAGRQAARMAMAQIGWSDAAIPSAPDRSPVWPPGLTGSITHTRQTCVAVTAPLTKVRSIGIDLENDVPMEPALWGVVCTPDEKAWIAAQPEPLRSRWVTWLFSAKEAFYKWQHPLTGQMLDFLDVHVALDTSTLRFDVSPAPGRSVSLPVHRESGRFLITHGQVLSVFGGPDGL